MANPELENYEKPKPGINVMPMTTAERDQWVTMTANTLPAIFTAKYKAGQVEHKGDLGSVPLMSILEEMEQEAIDQLAYIRECKRRVMCVSGR
jgi:hypothetical protein